MASFCSCRDELAVTQVLAVAAQRPGDLIEAHRIFKHERLMPAPFAGGQTHGSVADEKPVVKAPWITPHLDPGHSPDTVVTDRATRFDLVATRRTARERFKAVSPPDLSHANIPAPRSNRIAPCAVGPRAAEIIGTESAELITAEYCRIKGCAELRAHHRGSRLRDGQRASA